MEPEGWDVGVEMMEERGSHIPDLGSGWMVRPFPEVGSTGRGAGWRAEECCEVLWPQRGSLARAKGPCRQTLRTGLGVARAQLGGRD